MSFREGQRLWGFGSPLRGETDETGRAAAGQRVFDVAVQGEALLADLDIVREAGSDSTALVKELSRVEGSHQMLIELSPKGDPDDPKMAPVISGVEIIEQG